MVQVPGSQYIPTISKKILITVPPHSMVLFRFLIESYDNLAQFTVLDRHQALLKVFFSPYQEKEVYLALKNVTDLLPINIHHWPEV